MATTKAQRAASARYDRENTKQVSVKLNTRTDAEMLAHLAAQPNVQGYIKRLVREDMYRIAEDGIEETPTMKNTNWHEVGTMGEMQDGKGNSLFSGAFGSGTYGLTTTVDGREVELCVRAEIGENVYGKADELLAKLAGGGRPRNW